MQEMISKLQDRIQKAADAVIGRIQKEEVAIRLKFYYFRKPERLDPNTYASKEELPFGATHFSNSKRERTVWINCTQMPSRT